MLRPILLIARPITLIIGAISTPPITAAVIIGAISTPPITASIIIGAISTPPIASIIISTPAITSITSLRR